MSELRVRVFDVGHGDSILAEYVGARGTTHYILIDCKESFREGKRVVPAYEYLKNKGINTIDLLVVTHLHKDHYSGIEVLLDNLEIRKIVVPPFVTGGSGMFRRLLEKYFDEVKVVLDRTDDPEVESVAKSIVSLLAYMVNHDDKLEEATGPNSLISVFECEDLVVRIYLPLKKVKGQLAAQIMQQDFTFEPFPSMNDASIAMELEVEGHKILFGGDSTLTQWREHRRMKRRDGVHYLSVSSLKVPHHGSKYNNTVEIYKYLLGKNASGALALVSADGRTHPDDEFLDMVQELGLKPYCTGFARKCAGRLLPFGALMNLDPIVRPFVVQHAIHNEPTACQGYVTVEITGAGVRAYNSTGLRCVYEPEVERVRAPW